MDSIDYLRELAAVAPHRGSASPNERKAARYPVAGQPFHTTRDNLYLMPAQVFALALAAAPVLPRMTRTPCQPGLPESQAIDRGYPAAEELFA